MQLFALPHSAKVTAFEKQWAVKELWNQKKKVVSNFPVFYKFNLV